MFKKNILDQILLFLYIIIFGFVKYLVLEIKIN